jgi:hypothetical protein
MMKTQTRALFAAMAAFAMTMAVAANHRDAEVTESKPATNEAVPKPVDILAVKAVETTLAKEPVAPAVNELNAMDCTVVSAEDIFVDNRQRQADVPSSIADPVT